MKRILAQNNSVVLQEVVDGTITLQLGYALGGITYKIENNNVKFYLKDDYFYKNCIFSADLPLNIDGTEYDSDHIAEAMGNLFPTSGGSGGGGNVNSVNGQTGDVVLDADDIGTYTTEEVDGLLEDIGLDIEGIEEDVDALEEAVADIRQDLVDKEHFRGYFATNAEIQTLEGTNGDYAYSAESGTIWVFNNNTWTDSQDTIPDQNIEKADTTPIMDGTAAIGASNKYAAADHVHPTDTSRASQSDLDALTSVVSGKADTSSTYSKSDVDTALAGKQDTLTAGSNITIQNNVISASGISFTDVDDIQLVNALPANPSARILYLIPV